MKGKGLWIAAGVVSALAVIFLFDGEFQAFAGGLLVAGVLFVLAVKKDRQAPKSENPPKTVATQTAHDSATVIQLHTPTSSDALDINDGSTFGVWDVSIHDADGQDVRFDRALYQNIVISSYNKKTGFAKIRGSRGDTYVVNLDRCSCEDFQRRGLPCKHIYKLALSRGFSADAFFSARSDVVWYADGGRVYHTTPDCRGLKSRYARRTTLALANNQGLHLCKSCSEK